MGEGAELGAEVTFRANRTVSTCGGSGLLSKDAGEVSVVASWKMSGKHNSSSMSMLQI